MVEEKILLSKEKLKELREELAHLEKEKRTELIKLLEEARSSDFSEEGDDFEEVLDEIQMVEMRILEIKDILSRSDVLLKNGRKKTVSLGSEVKLRHRGKILKLKIVSFFETNPLQNYISDQSPLGKALLKARLGEIVKLNVHGNVLKYELVGIN